jgi:GTP-binding protein
MKMDMGGLNLHNVELRISAGMPSQLIKSGLAQVALSGRSNVGKSSLVNSLLGRKKLARVSSEPGKTITVNYYEVDRKMLLVDLPGYGFANRSKEDTKKWSTLTQNYFEENDALKLVLQLVDIKVGFTKDDLTMLEYMNYYNVPYIVVATKCDKVNKTQLTENAQKIAADSNLRAGTEIILYSSEKNIGRDELWGIILKYKKA